MWGRCVFFFSFQFGYFENEKQLKMLLKDTLLKMLQKMLGVCLCVLVCVCVFVSRRKKQRAPARYHLGHHHHGDVCAERQWVTVRLMCLINAFVFTTSLHTKG